MPSLVPGWTADTYLHLVEQRYADTPEIGHHGYEHEYVVHKGRDVECEVLLKGIDSLKRITSEVPEGSRSRRYGSGRVAHSGYCGSAVERGGREIPVGVQPEGKTLQPGG